MSIIIFIIILAVLIFVHEMGHFLAAKASGIRVDEFAIGFPPTLYSKKIGETKYSINAIPFGGYVKIHGENPDEESLTGEDKNRSMANKPKRIQAMVLIAGIVFNVVFAWFLISIALAFGLPSSIPQDFNRAYVKDSYVVILDVAKDSPADKAGIKNGDSIVGGRTLTEIQETIKQSEGNPVFFNIQNEAKEIRSVEITPTLSVSDTYVAGIAMNEIGTIKTPWYIAPYEGAKITISSIKAMFAGLYVFFRDIAVGQPDFASVSGPVGIVGLVGDAATYGFIYLLGFTALISLNLAVINILPFPALDGGRLFFILIEAIKGSPIKPKVANTLNALGFVCLILLMLVVTYKDIAKLIFK